MTQFIAVDGEADKQGRYILLCDSTGRVLFDDRGISTNDALDFLLALPKGYEIVCFGLNYDANQWMRDLPLANLARIANENRTTFRGQYKLEWIPSKLFSVSIPGKTVAVCEVFGFFQTSFVKALQQWGFTPPSEIVTMKEKRGGFTQAEVQRITAYCLAECRLLVQLMDKLNEACIIAGCVPQRRWIGAGSIASALLTREGVKAHHAYDPEVWGAGVTDDYVLRAYFGGRVELYSQGWTTGALVEDVRSAYPAGATGLPSLVDAKTVHLRRYEPEHRYALYRVKWDAHSGVRVTPFPVRLPSGQICYPLSGEGVYHAAEVAVALSNPSFNVRILDGWALVPSTRDLPFAWIPDVYEIRRRFKREGSHAQKALKLGLNSVYGKTAQGYGFGRKPPFQSYFWAGYITSSCRARVLQRLMYEPNPVMCATDGVVSALTSQSITEDDPDELGTWERSTYERIATIQPGVYVADVDGQRIVKSRGFFARDVDYGALVDQFYDDPQGCYHFDSRRFIGLKVALHRTDKTIWRKWVEERRSIAFEIQNKNSVTTDDGRVLLHPISGPYESLPYVPKQSLYDDPTDDTLENMVRDDQPHRDAD